MNGNCNYVTNFARGALNSSKIEKRWLTNYIAYFEEIFPTLSN